MKKITAVIALTAALFSTAALAAPKWNNAWTQGVTELNVRGAGQSQLNFSCNSYPESRAARIVYFTDADGREIDGGAGNAPDILVTINGKEVQLSNDGFSAGAGNWQYFWEQAAKLKSDKITVKVKGTKPATFTVIGLKALATDKDLKFCTLN